MKAIQRTIQIAFAITGLCVGLLAGIVFGVSSASTTTTTGPTINVAVPSYCLSPTATHRTYPLNIPASDTFARSGEHGHGNLTCIVFMTRTYSKTLVIDQATGGYVIGPLGLDVTYVNCKLPGYRFPPPPFTGANDCGESWGQTENDWRYQSGPAIGQQMYPASTP